MKPVSMSFETGFIVLFIGTLSATTEQNKGFTFNIAPFFRLFITKNGSEACFRFKKGSLELQKKALSNFKRALLDNG